MDEGGGVTTLLTLVPTVIGSICIGMSFFPQQGDKLADHYFTLGCIGLAPVTIGIVILLGIALGEFLFEKTSRPPTSPPRPE